MSSTLAALGARTTPAFRVRLAPSAAAIRRLINRTCPGGSAGLPGYDPAGTGSLAVDGKSARGSRHQETPAAHLIAAMTGTGMTVSQLRVPDKTNETTCFAALLEPYDLTGVAVTENHPTGPTPASAAHPGGSADVWRGRDADRGREVERRDGQYSSSGRRRRGAPTAWRCRSTWA